MKKIFLTAMASFRTLDCSAGLMAIVYILLLSSCQKDSGVDTGVAALNVALEAIDTDVVSTLKLSSDSAQSASSSKTIQQTTVALGNEVTMVATLTPVDVSASIKGRLTASAGKTMATGGTTPVSGALEAGVYYRLVVYDGDNNYVTDKVYIKGGDNNDVFYLEVGKTYTFVSFSINSKTTVPSVDTSKKLTAATVGNLDGNGALMYFMKKITLVKGENYLGIKLKHVFSEITTTVDASALSGNIISCSAQVSPHHEKIAVQLANGTLLATGNAGSKSMSFPTLNAKTVTSTATKIALPATTTGAITLSSIQVGTITRSNLALKDLSIQPGVRYTLTLKLAAAGVNGIDIGGYLWAPGNLTYNRSTNTYSFEKDQSVAGEYWIYNWLSPKRYQTQENWIVAQSIANAYKEDRDPCRKVSTHGGSWRTPTSAELQTLVSKGVRFGNYGTVSGVFFGTSTTPSSADKDKYVFFANTGYSDMNGGGVRDVGTEGRYWSATMSSNVDHANGMWFRAGWNNYMNLSHEYVLEGRSIRCVKNK